MRPSEQREAVSTHLDTEAARRGGVVVVVPGAHLVGFAGRGELFEAVLAHGFQQSVAHSVTRVVGDDQGLVHQQAKHINELGTFGIAVGAHRLGGVQVEATGEHS